MKLKKGTILIKKTIISFCFSWGAFCFIGQLEIIMAILSEPWKSCKDWFIDRYKMFVIAFLP